MLSFYSASARIINSRRAVNECMEVALGENISDCSLLIWHASIGHNFDEILDEAHRLAPHASVLLSSCCGVVGKEGVSESMKDIALMAIKGEDFGIAHCNDFYGHNAYQKTLAMAQELKQSKQGINMLYFLGSGINTDNNAVIQACEEVFGPEVSLFGATSSDNMKGFVNYQGVNQNLYQHGAFLLGLADPSLKVETAATHGFVAIGEPLVVTSCQGNTIETLNGKPAWSEYLRRLGLPENATCGETIPVGALGEKLSPSLAEEYGNQHLLRVVTSHDGQTMHYATGITQGTELWLTKRDEALIFGEMEKMVNQMKLKLAGKTPVAVFHADCLARGRFLHNRIIKEELVSSMQVPFFDSQGNCPPWLGMYGFGEFARLGNKNTYHNYTTALYVLYR